MKTATKQSHTRNFHLPLPADSYEGLQLEAAREGRPATVVAREVIQAWLRERRKKAIHEEIARFAGRVAGSPLDLDAGLEKAAAEQLRGIESGDE